MDITLKDVAKRCKDEDIESFVHEILDIVKLLPWGDTWFLSYVLAESLFCEVEEEVGHGISDNDDERTRRSWIVRHAARAALVDHQRKMDTENTD